MQETTRQSTNREGKKKLFPPVKSFEERFQEGFEGEDILERRKTGEALSDLLNNVDDPLVVALDGKWGTGKTWFLQRWTGHHHKNNESSTVVYFDAFAHDYLSDPLPALVSALAKNTTDRNIQRIKKIAFKLTKTLTRVGMRVVATNGTSEIIGAGIKAIGPELEKNIDEYWKVEKGKAAAMEQFKDALKSLAANKKVIFVLDELDRCRPDYALEVLEVIKHFFSVPNVHFVLGVNLEALENMVRTRYGNSINAKIYLQKFIQITLELPNEFGGTHQRTKDVSVYLDRLCKEMNVPKHIADKLIYQIKLVARSNPISLRHIEHIISAVNLASSRVRNKNDGITDGMYSVMTDLIIARIVRFDLYPKFLDATITEPKLKKYFGATDKILKENDINSEIFNTWDIRLRYGTWLFITQNERFQNLGDEDREGILNNLYGYNHRRSVRKNPQELPKFIQSNWLDLFQFYDPSTPKNNI